MAMGKRGLLCIAVGLVLVLASVDNKAALATYSSVGFEVVDRLALYQK
jgi:hypothetical protein